MHKEIWYKLNVLAGQDYDDSIGDSITIDKADALTILNEIDTLNERLEEYYRLERDLGKLLGV